MSDDMPAVKPMSMKWLLIHLDICIGSGILIIWALARLIAWAI